MLRVSPAEGTGVDVSISCSVIEWQVRSPALIPPALVSFVWVLLLLLLLLLFFQVYAVDFYFSLQIYTVDLSHIHLWHTSSAKFSHLCKIIK